MPTPNHLYYLDDILRELQKQWPANRTVNIVCHGHSVPAGYFAAPYVDTFNSYPHLLHRIIKERFPFACCNVIVTAIGGESSVSGYVRFKNEVLCHRPDVVTIDYALNDVTIGLQTAKIAWSGMIEEALGAGVKVILLTPSWDKSYYTQDGNWEQLLRHMEQIRALAHEYGVGLADAAEEFNHYIACEGDLADLLSHFNHPNRKGHEIIANEIARWFIAK